MPQFEVIDTGKVKLRVALEGRGPLVLLVHGFPESWHSWRHQLGPIASAGFTACAVDVRGYGGSDKPHAIDAYTLEALSGDTCGLIDKLSPDAPAILIGHDWGAPVVWTTALVHPERVRAVAGLSVPYAGVPARSLSDVIHAVYTAKGRFFYMHRFDQEGVAEAELEADVRSTVRRLYYAWSGDAPAGTWPSDKQVGDAVLAGLPDPIPFPDWMSEADLDHLVADLSASGFRGPLNRYRNHTRDFEYLRQFNGRKIEQPALFIAGDKDIVLTMFGDRMAAMKTELPGLRGLHLLPGCGHWVQQERPDEVNALLLDWLRGL